MTVLPDILLPGAGLAANRSAPAAAERSAREADAARFSELYAKERQARPAERSSEPARRDNCNDGQARAADRGQAPEHARRHERLAGARTAVPANEPAAPAAPAAAAATDEPDGKDLPLALDAEASSGEDDPLMLLGLPLGEPPLPVAEAESLVEGGDKSRSAGEQPAEEPVALALPAVALLANQPTPEPAAEEPLVLRSEPQLQLATSLPGKSASAADSAAGEGELADSSQQQSQGNPAERLLAVLSESATANSAREAPKENFALRLNGLTQALAQQSGVSARPAALVPGQPLALQTQGMSEAVVERVMWMSSQNLRSAEIQLDPAELGRMEVRIEMNKDQAQVTFLSPHAGVREALEGQAQRLREMFTQQGLNLADVNVSDQSLARGWQGQGGEQQGRGEGRGRDRSGDDEVIVGSSEIAANRQNGQRGLVDFYA